MIQPRQSRTIRRYLLAFAASAIAAHAVLGERGTIQMHRARSEHRALAASIAALRGENARLRVEARRLQTDRRAIEAIARRELGLAARGERLVRVVTR